MEKVIFLKGDFLEKIWGGNQLKKEFNYDIPSEKTGEYWAVSAMDAHESKVLNTDYNLKEFYDEHRELFGNQKKREFPLLVKLIDASDDLSIQVHPDDEMAREENANGKTECWYCLNKKESSIIYGNNAKDTNDLKNRILNKDFDGLFKEVKTIKDDFFYVPSGTIHAIKKGSLILEIQQSSDITYRLYDYDRVDKNGQLRQLHIEKSAKAVTSDVKEYEKIKANKTKNLIDEKYFGVDVVKINEESIFNQDKKYKICAVIDGEGKLLIDKKEFSIKKGDFFIILNNCRQYKYNGILQIVESYSNEE